MYLPLVAYGILYRLYISKSSRLISNLLHHSIFEISNGNQTLSHCLPSISLTFQYLTRILGGRRKQTHHVTASAPVDWLEAALTPLIQYSCDDVSMEFRDWPIKRRGTLVHIFAYWRQCTKNSIISVRQRGRREFSASVDMLLNMVGVWEVGRNLLPSLSNF